VDGEGAFLKKLSYYSRLSRVCFSRQLGLIINTIIKWRDWEGGWANYCMIFNEEKKGFLCNLPGFIEWGFCCRRNNEAEESGEEMHQAAPHNRRARLIETTA
jgi:hypothetical protein